MVAVGPNAEFLCALRVTEGLDGGGGGESGIHYSLKI